jgi:hypothetical protein
MVIIAKERVRDIATRLKLPLWWVTSVIVEYFPCRRFAENGELWLFDFSIFDDSLINEIPSKNVVIPEYRLFQNITPKELAIRAARLIAGESQLALDNRDLVPEGIVNRTAFPYLSNPIDKWDPKLGFNQYTLVYDKGYFYQWKISELYHINSQSSWYKSDFLELKPLWNICRQLMNIRKNGFKNAEPKLVTRINSLYENLEKTRRPLRSKILKYHNRNKVYYETTKADVMVVPLASFFDSLRVGKNGYEIESYMEPLFYRAAMRSLNPAEESKKIQDQLETKADGIIDEMEYSSICIISCASCLESYINYIITRYLREESNIFIRTLSLNQKWLWVPVAMNLPFRFNIDEYPFNLFTQLIQWRNNAMHSIPQYKKVKKYRSKAYRGTRSHTYSIFNVENARASIDTVQKMISKLSEGGKIPLPRWFTAFPNYE